MVDEAPAGGFDRRQLQLLLGAEVREQAALAHAELGGEATDGQALESLDRSQVGGGLEDRLARAVATAPAPVGLVVDHGLCAGESLEVLGRRVHR